MYIIGFMWGNRIHKRIVFLQNIDFVKILPFDLTMT